MSKRKSAKHCCFVLFHGAPRALLSERSYKHPPCSRRITLGQAEQVAQTGRLAAGIHDAYMGHKIAGQVEGRKMDAVLVALHRFKQEGAVAKWLSEKIMHKTRILFRAKTAQKGSGFLFLHDFFVQAAIAFLFCNSPFVFSFRRKIGYFFRLFASPRSPEAGSPGHLRQGWTPFPG